MRGKNTGGMRRRDKPSNRHSQISPYINMDVGNKRMSERKGEP